MSDPTPPQSLSFTYKRQFRRCGKPACKICAPDQPGHGPYWYVYWREGGRMRSRYLGRQAPEGLAAGVPVEPAPTEISPVHPALRVRTLGAFVAWRGAERLPLERWTRRKAVELFKLLIGAPGQCLRREQIVEALWPEDVPEAGSGRLRTVVYALRTALDLPVSGSGADGRRRSYLRSEGDLLRLDPAPGGLPPEDWLDAVSFSSAAAPALAGHDAGACREALALYTGDFLPDEPYVEWIVARREELRRHYLALLPHLARLCAADGEPDEAERLLRAALAADPTHEAAAQRLMALLASAGRRGEALRVYQALATSLRDDLNVAPSPRTEALRRRSLAPPTNLPAPLAGLIGRDEDLATVCKLLANTRLLTLTGAGGGGKTRLALAAARAVLPEYPDGVWLIDLAPLRDATSATHALAALFDVRAKLERLLLEAVGEALRDRRALLVLDNCEHLIAACGQIVRLVLQAAPEVRILATSRERLGLAEETVWRVPALSLPDPASDLDPETLRRSGAVQLLVARAQAARAGFALTGANAAAMVRICRRLDGIPLALELAAGRLALLEPEALAARLDQSFAVLGSRHAAPARHQTLRAALDWSVVLLTKPERTLLQRLSIFAGGWTVDAAEQICAGEGIAAAEMLDLLESLLAKSLIAMADVGRYRLLEPVRQYARERLEATNTAPVLHARHLSWCVALAEAAVPGLRGPEQATWLDRLDREHGNLLQALEWGAGAARRRAEAPPMALRLAGALWHFWQIRGHLAEGRHWLTRALAIGAESPPPARRGPGRIGHAVDESG